MAFTKQAVEFLMENKFHDSRDLFKEHRAQYDELVLAPMRELVTQLAPGLLALDSRLIAEPKVGRSISRIYRDTRFTKDKSIFRDVVWCVFMWEKKLYEGPPAFFFEFSPSKVRWGCGFYRASTAAMDTMRGLIVRGDAAFDDAVKALGDDGYFELEGERYKRSKFPHAQGVQRQWLDLKSVSAVRNSGDFKLLCSDALPKVLLADFTRLKPVYDFFCKAQAFSFAEEQEEANPLPKAPKQQFDW